jgi:cation diffusion facilitator family transporter
MEHDRISQGSRLPARPQHEIQSDKRSAALLSVLAACVMTGLKLLAGILTGSLGMLSESAHSGLDLLGSTLTYISVRLSDKPADEGHTYGHGKIENLSAFAETFLMAASCIWIVTEAVSRIAHPVALRFSPWPFAVLLLSIAVDYTRSRQLARIAHESASQALEADALHFRSDIWSSLAVLIGLVATYSGGYFHIGWLRYTDPAVAIFVSAIIFKVSWKLASQTAEVLLDAAPMGMRRHIADAARATPGVLDVEQVRVRRAGSAYFADLTIALSRGLTFQRTEALVEAVTQVVKGILPGSDVVVRTVAREGYSESIFDRIRAVASRNNVLLHDVSVQSFDEGLHVEQHIEVPETLTLKEAHSFVCNIEGQIRKDVPEIFSVLTHIESEPATIEKPSGLQRDRRMEQQLRTAAAELPSIIDIHDVNVSRVTDHLQISCHCTLPDELPMHEVHAVITALEDRFKLACPEVYRVLIHPEPATDNSHERHVMETQTL